MAIVRGVDNIVLYRGDTPTFRYQMLDINEDTQQTTPIDITNFTITAQVRHSLTDASIWVTLPIIKTDAANGIFQWRLTSDQSDALTPITSTASSGIYDMQIVVNEGQPDEETITFLVGTFTVTKDITRDSTPRRIKR